MNLILKSIGRVNRVLGVISTHQLVYKCFNYSPLIIVRLLCLSLFCRSHKMNKMAELFCILLTSCKRRFFFHYMTKTLIQKEDIETCSENFRRSLFIIPFLSFKAQRLTTNDINKMDAFLNFYSLHQRNRHVTEQC